MLIILFIASLVVALTVSGILTFLIGKPLNGVLTRVVGEESIKHWHRFGIFTIYAMGVARGIDTNRLRYDLQNPNASTSFDNMGIERWILELYRVSEDTLAGVMIASLTIFALSLIAFVIVRGFETKK